ncbi:MAG: HEAT repeat domain-containing protein [Deltaproteobacteria bacterium]|nr:HEAT repeat domain-containing protein [Deltaproteobacteria bacterium]
MVEPLETGRTKRSLLLPLLVGLLPAALALGVALFFALAPRSGGGAAEPARRPVLRRGAPGGPPNEGRAIRAGSANPAAEGEGGASRLLALLPTDPDVLVNVTADELPGTADLTRLGRAATTALSEGLLNNLDDGVRAACAWALAEIRDPAARDTLVLALDDASPDVRLHAVRALGNLGDPAHADRILALLRDPSEPAWVQAAAVDALGAIGEPRSLDLLFAVARDPQRAYLWSGTARALWATRARLPRAKLIRAFLGFLAGDEVVAGRAVRYLGWLGATEAVDALAAHYEGRDAAVQNQVILAMGRIGSPGARSFLREVALQTQNARHLNNASIALARLGERAWVLDNLVGLLGDPRAYFRFNAAFALGEVGGGEAKATDALVAALADANDLVRSEAAVALGRLRDPRAVPALEAGVESDNPFVQLDMVVALNRIDGERFRHLVLEELLSGETPHPARVRERAIRLLAEAGDPRVVPEVLALLRSGDVADLDQALRALAVVPAFDPAPFVPALAYTVMTQGPGTAAALNLVRDRRVAGMERFLLETAWHSSGATSEQIYLALGAVAAEADVAAIAAVPERDDTTRLYQDFSLANLGGTASLDRLVDVLRGGSLEQRRDAAFLLGFVERPGIEERLLLAMREAEPLTAVQVAAALLPHDVPEAYRYLSDTMRRGNPALAEEAERTLRVSRAAGVAAFLEQSLAAEHDPTMRQRLAMLLEDREPDEYR